MIVAPHRFVVALVASRVLATFAVGIAMDEDSFGSEDSFAAEIPAVTRPTGSGRTLSSAPLRTSGHDSEDEIPLRSPDRCRSANPMASVLTDEDDLCAQLNKI